MASTLATSELGPMAGPQAPRNVAGHGSPGTATIVKYGPDGKTEAKHVDASYQAVAFNAAGAIAGGKINLTSQTPGKKALSASSASFGSDGRPTIVTSSIFDRRTGAKYRNLHVDLSGLNYSVVHRIASGQIKLSAKDADGVGPVLDGVVSFAAEQLSGLDLTHYLTDGSGNVGGYSKVSFDNAQFLGDRIVGGHLLISTQRHDRTLASRSRLTYTAEGLPASLSSDSYAANGTDLKASTIADYSSVAFDALRHVVSGQLSSTTHDGKGRVRAHAVVAYAGGAPQSATTRSFGKAGELLARTETSFAGAVFNNRNHVVNSSVSLKSFDRDGKPLSTAEVQFDRHGNPVKRTITSYAPDGKSVARRTLLDYARAVFDHHRKVVRGQVRSTTTVGAGTSTIQAVRHYNGTNKFVMKEVSVQESAGGSVQQSSKIIRRRPDGTLAEITSQTRGAIAKVTQYGTDGKTIIKQYQVDYSSANVSGGSVVGGTVSINSKDGNQRALSSSKLDYSK